ncbi:MAG TPA: DUF222 domain-containing protein [Actinomycetota bacterium]|nr:DUF222 domain-containing protein [Actinomycetota bacterium]
MGPLAAAVDALAAEDLTRLPDAEAAQRVLVLRGLLERLEGQWLRELAAVDARGAAGAEEGAQAPSTAGWLRRRARLGATDAHQRLRVARALHRGPLVGTAQALAGGEISATHAAVLAGGTQDLPAPTVVEAEPVLVDAARRLDPPRLRRLVAHLAAVADPDAADAQAQRQHGRRGLWVSPTLAGMVAVDGLLEAEAGATLLAALEPLARPTSAEDERSGSQRRADALTELARRALEGGRLPQTGGVRPQLTVTVELASLLAAETGMPGGDGGWAGPLPAETCRRLACDAALTRVLVARDPNHHSHTGGDPGGLAARLQTTMALLPAALGGAPTQPLEVGRTARVVTAAQRAALAVRDGGCAFPGCDRPVAWCDAHHLRHWLHGGPTDLANLALLCRAHHRAVHEGGWHLQRHPNGHLAATPPHPRQPAAA